MMTAQSMVLFCHRKGVSTPEIPRQCEGHISGFKAWNPQMITAKLQFCFVIKTVLKVSEIYR